MNALNKLVVDSLINNNIPAVEVQPSSCIVTENGRIQSLEARPLIKMLGAGFTPVLYGDVVLDFETGFTILSGDQLVTSLAIRLGAERIIFGVDVNGLFTEDPKTNPSARLLKEISLKKMKNLVNRIGGSTETDVTGGMFGKMFEVIKVLESGIQTLIVNAKKPERVYKALRGEKVVGTVLQKGESLG
jgi:isopentenyl phosphate kinase